MVNEQQDIFTKIITDFNNKFVTKFKGESDIEKILYFNDVLDSPEVLNKRLTEIPSLYAYYASVKRDATQKLEEMKNKLSMYEQTGMEAAINSLKEKGAKTPTQKAIDAEFKLIHDKDEKYSKFMTKLKEVEQAADKIGVIERAILTEMDCLRIIATLLGNMMNTGIYIKPKGKNGGF